MSLNTVVFALLLYPVLYSLPFNWVRFMWGMQRGIAPMPPDVEEHAEVVDREVFLFMHGSLLAIVVYLLRGSSISTAAVGLSSYNWASAVALGALFSVAPLGLGALTRRISPPDKRRKDQETRGPAAGWLGIVLLASFSHELWRAFCIVGLIRLETPTWFAVPITACAYGSIQLFRNKARALGSAFFGCLAGFLFIKAGSLLAPLAMSLITGVGHFYQVRYLQPRTPPPFPPFRCPVCSQTIENMLRPATLEFGCPNCGGSLKRSLPRWLPFVFGIAGAGLTLYLLHASFIWYWWFFAPLSVFFALISGLIVAMFLPGIGRVVVNRGPFDSKQLRL